VEGWSEESGKGVIYLAPRPPPPSLRPVLLIFDPPPPPPLHPAPPQNHRKPTPFAESSLPYYHYDSIGDFEMRWDFVGSGSSEMIELELTLYSDIFVGIGFDCTSSRMCDMVVGNGGGRSNPFLEDYFEVEGDREPHTDEDLGGSNDLNVVSLEYKNYASVLRFTRKLDTGDKWDAVIKKDYMDLVYAWCEEVSFF